MDRNSVIGLVLIGAILVVFSILNQPTKEDIQALERKRDSIAAVEEARQKAEALVAEARQDSLRSSGENLPDSVLAKMRADTLGFLANTATGEDQYYVLENEKIKLTLSNRGGRIVSAEVKNYRTWDSLPLFLFVKERSDFGLHFFADNRAINTSHLYFAPRGKSFSLKGDETKSFAMRLEAGANTYIEYVYTLSGNSYVVDFDLHIVGMENYVAPNTNRFDLHWSVDALRQEKNRENELTNTTIYYRYADDETGNLSETADERKNLEATTTWISLKNQFFTSAIIAREGLEKPITVETKTLEEDEEFLKTLTAELTIPYDHKPSETQSFDFYFGPNHYKTLQKLEVDMESIIPLGWAIFKWVNKYCVIPVFNFLDGLNLGYGLIILLLTILIKLVLFPLTYKTYLSGAKMRVLKPEIDELNKKFKPEEAMKKQQAMMSLYRQAGVNPLGGCIPMLLQMPILYAMFRFFPASIELRQEGFLWADDLSTYDSILELPFTIPFYGSHVSLFTLLMTASIFLTMKYNTGQYGGNEQMAKQMKIIMYIMPISFMCFLNNYSSGLTYYYFAANMITFFQQFAIKRFVDEDAIHRKIQENKKRPPGQVKSRFQQRLEEMAKQKGGQRGKK